MAPSPDLATYVGPMGNFLGDGTELIAGKTVVEIGRGEAEASAFWRPVGGKQAVAKARRKGVKTRKQIETPPSPPPAEAVTKATVKEEPVS